MPYMSSLTRENHEVTVGHYPRRPNRANGHHGSKPLTSVSTQFPLATTATDMRTHVIILHLFHSPAELSCSLIQSLPRIPVTRRPEGETCTAARGCTGVSEPDLEVRGTRVASNCQKRKVPREQLILRTRAGWH
ncbi:hypothetical protein SCLCIDRAFT_682131 [Scleroderma citrinum Foug A]|uniref:Uncharacterized protein n=1 Tax=Scleroderma citrinum Foug A TaxID=1036808 RepID=A0A0C3DTT6_9AGAM|nr:hypothetical protein SCLCIDRAFT_682131 [Scleroderma citrinum Foug A]